MHRIEVTNGTVETRRFYLKQFPATEPRKELEEHLSRLQAISRALRNTPGISPYVVTGCDAERHLLLTEEVDGASIITLHRKLSRRWGRSATEVVNAWQGVGSWLRALHHQTLPPVASAAKGAELGAYTEERLVAWGRADRRQNRLAARAVEILSAVTTRLPSSLPLVPCHGDVSGYNILVGRTVGLIDFDDLRFDLPGLDLSQAILELRNLSRVARVLPLRHVREAAERALLVGYGRELPKGPELWLPHLRNLSVFLITLARRRNGISLSRASDELQYVRTVQQLKRTIRIITGTSRQVDRVEASAI